MYTRTHAQPYVVFAAIYAYICCDMTHYRDYTAELVAEYGQYKAVVMNGEVRNYHQLIGLLYAVRIVFLVSFS